MISDKHIWILEDDPGVQFIYQETLGYRYKVTLFQTLGEFRAALSDARDTPDLLIADLKLPDGTFLAYLNSDSGTEGFSFPFIVVSSVVDLDALRFCFERGALDYIIKPFQKSELIAKTERALASGDLRALAEAFPTDIGTLHLTATERNILVKIHDAGPGGVSREALIGVVWKGVAVNPKTIDVHVSNLRKKLSARGLDIRIAGQGRWTIERVSENGSRDGMKN